MQLKTTPKKLAEMRAFALEAHNSPGWDSFCGVTQDQLNLLDDVVTLQAELASARAALEYYAEHANSRVARMWLQEHPE